MILGIPIKVMLKIMRMMRMVEVMEVIWGSKKEKDADDTKHRGRDT